MRSKKEGLNTLLDNGEQNPVAKLLVSVLSTLAEIDYKNRREAQREGIARAKAEEKYNGRVNGTSLSDVDLVEKHSDIVTELNKGEAIRRTAKLTERSTSTVQRVKKSVGTPEINGLKGQLIRRSPPRSEIWECKLNSVRVCSTLDGARPIKGCDLDPAVAGLQI